MSLWRAIKNLVGIGNGAARPALVLASEEGLLDYLIDLVNRSDMIADELAARKAIDSIRTGRAKVLACARLYFRLENFLVTNKPLVTKKEFPLASDLHKEIAFHISVGELSLPLRLIFLPAHEQAAALFDFALQDLIAATRRDLGETVLRNILAGATRGTLLDGVMLEGDIYDFSQISAKVSKASAVEIQFAFKKVYRELFGKISLVLGQQSATAVAEMMYGTISENFSQTLLSLFLDVVPESLLASQRLFILSREELQKRVLAATADLHRLNDSLEEKVRQRTKELTDANLKLQELDKLKTEFVSIAAHQLRTPATRLKWLMSVILDDPTAPQSTYLEKLRSASHSIDQLIDLINDLLDISRIEEGHWGIEPLRQPLDVLVSDACADAREAATAKGISFSLKLQPQLPDLYFDRAKILIVLNNLLDNAVKYTQSGGTISCEVTRDTDFITTTVRDSGIGIPRAEADRIFSKFYRSDGARNVHTEGTGLGLFVSKKIVEIHHGAIGFESTPEHGTSFHFSLPIPNG